MKTIVATLCVGFALLVTSVLRAQPVLETPEDTAVIRLRPGQLPTVRVSGSLLYRLLVAEMAAQRDDYETAASMMLDLARTIGDVRLARQGLQWYLEVNNLPGALAAAREWLRLSPTDEQAYWTELALMAASGHTQGLAAALRARMMAAVDNSADPVATIKQVHATLAHVRKREEALAILDEALLPATRQLPEARLALAALAHAAGDSDRAVTEARLALALQPDSEDAARAMLEYGLQAGKVDHSVAQSEADAHASSTATVHRAIADARRFAARYPNARRLRLALAQAFAESQRYDEALAELQAMASHAPEDFDLLFMQAQVQMGADRLPQARELLHQYIAVQLQRRAANRSEADDATVGLADAWVLLARIAEQQNQLDAAVALLARVDDEAMRYAARLRQALLLARLQRVDEALALVQGLDAQDEGEAIRAALTAAQILRNAGRVAQAIAELEAADEDFPDTVPVKYELAMLYERQDNLVEFERLLRAVMVLEPNHAQAHNALGYTLADRGIRLAEAQDLIARAHALRPDDPYILDSLGWIYYRLGQHERALTYLQRAWEAQPEVDIAAHLGEVLWLTGQRDAAQQRWRDGAALDADNETLSETLRRLGVSLGEP